MQVWRGNAQRGISATVATAADAQQHLRNSSPPARQPKRTRRLTRCAGTRRGRTPSRSGGRSPCRSCGCSPRASAWQKRERADGIIKHCAMQSRQSWSGRFWTQAPLQATRNHPCHCPPPPTSLSSILSPGCAPGTWGSALCWRSATARLHWAPPHAAQPAHQPTAASARKDRLSHKRR